MNYVYKALSQFSAVGFVKVFALSFPVVITGLFSTGSTAQVFSKPEIRQPESVAISVTDLESTSKWYQECLGFSVISQKDFPDLGIKTAILGSGSFQLELVKNANTISKEQAFKDNDGKTVAGFGKIAFRIKDVKLLYEQLKTKGASFVTPLRPSSITKNDEYFIVRDPEGNWMQFTSSK